MGDRRVVIPVIVGILILGSIVLSQTAETFSDTSESLDANDQSTPVVLDSKNLELLDPFAISIKTADETLTNNAILQNDDELFVALEANKVYAFEFRPFLISNGSPGFKYSFDVPEGAIVRINDNEWQANTARTAIDGTTSLFIYTNNSDEKTFEVHGYVITSSTAGYLQLQWSQNTSHADTTTLKAGSSLVVLEEGSSIIKTIDETLNDNNTVQNDDELFVALEANKRYAFEQRVFLDSSTTTEFKYAFTIPSDATIKINNSDWDDTIPSSSLEKADFPVLISTENGETVLEIHGHVIMSSTPGNLQFQWSQLTSDASDTTVKKGSSLVIWEESSQSVIKSSDEALNDNNTVQNDDELFVALEANKRYAFEQRVLIVADSVKPDFKYTFDVPTGATIKINSNDWDSNTARNSIDGTSIIPFIPLGTSDRYIQIHGFVETSSTPGNLQFKWSQNTNHTDNVTVKTGSSLRVYVAGS